LGTSSYKWSNVYAGNVSGTITTSNQPNITGLGTLGSLSVTGNVTAGNIRASGTINADNFLSSDIYVGNVWAGSATVNGNISATGNISGTNLTINGLLLTAPSTKAANATGVAGQVSWDSNYIYVCVATNTWKRTALVGGY
jgi:cytoskeletal protein CcmA (bactofilin family)